MAQLPKGGLLRGRDKPIHWSCAIYFSGGIVERLFSFWDAIHPFSMGENTHTAARLQSPSSETCHKVPVPPQMVPMERGDFAFFTPTNGAKTWLKIVDFCWIFAPKKFGTSSRSVFGWEVVMVFFLSIRRHELFFKRKVLIDGGLGLGNEAKTAWSWV